MSNHGWIRLKKDKVALKLYMSNHGWIRLKKVTKCQCQITNVKSWLNTLKYKVAKCTCQIMVEYA